VSDLDRALSQRDRLIDVVRDLLHVLEGDECPEVETAHAVLVSVGAEGYLAPTSSEMLEREDALRQAIEAAPPEEADRLALSTALSTCHAMVGDPLTTTRSREARDALHRAAKTLRRALEREAENG